MRLLSGVLVSVSQIALNVMFLLESKRHHEVASESFSGVYLKLKKTILKIT